jgi:hypothetical protein
MRLEPTTRLLGIPRSLYVRTIIVVEPSVGMAYRGGEFRSPSGSRDWHGARFGGLSITRAGQTMRS